MKTTLSKLLLFTSLLLVALCLPRQAAADVQGTCVKAQCSCGVWVDSCDPTACCAVCPNLQSMPECGGGSSSGGSAGGSASVSTDPRAALIEGMAQAGSDIIAAGIESLLTPTPEDPAVTAARQKAEAEAAARAAAFRRALDAKALAEYEAYLALAARYDREGLELLGLVVELSRAIDAAHITPEAALRALAAMLKNEPCSEKACWLGSVRMSVARHSSRGCFPNLNAHAQKIRGDYSDGCSCHDDPAVAAMPPEIREKLKVVAEKLKNLLADYKQLNQDVIDKKVSLAALEAKDNDTLAALTRDKAATQARLDSLNTSIADAKDAAKKAADRVVLTDAAVRAVGWPGKLSAQEKDRYDALKKELADEKADAEAKKKTLDELTKVQVDTQKALTDIDQKTKAEVDREKVELDKQKDALTRAIDLLAQNEAALKQDADDAAKIPCSGADAASDPACASGGLLAVPRKVHFKYPRASKNEY